MASATETGMAKSKGRPKKTGGEGSQVRIDSDLAKRARYMAAQRGVSIAEYLSRILRPVIEQDFRQLARDMLKGDK